MKMKMTMMRMRMKTSPWLLFLGLALIGTTAAAGPGSCVSRCGEGFTRGQQCNCDPSCLQHNECCQDYLAVCTNVQSCQGRCGETFRRGRTCECDSQCIHYNTCCQDYQQRCDAYASPPYSRTFQPLPLRSSGSGKRKSEKGRKRSNSESEEWYTARGRCTDYPGAQCPRASGPIHPLNNGYFGPAHPYHQALPTDPLRHGAGNMPEGLQPMSNRYPHGGAPDSPVSGSYLPSYSAPSLGNGASASPSGPGAADGKVNIHLVLSPGGLPPSGPRQGLSGTSGSGPGTLQDLSHALGLPLAEAGLDGQGTGSFADADLCSDSLINGLTALLNGTVLIFKGGQFWSVDPTSRSASRPQSITETLGVPSPIDTVFTRCNCQGNTYIIKGDQYWRLDENLAMEPGYPKPLTSEFPGLTGNIRAALPAPASRSRPESVYFFKNGDIMQRFTFPPSNTPACSKKPSRFAPLADPDVPLSGEINLKVSLKGFPGPITSALSMPNPQSSDRYEHVVFSGPLYFSVQVSGDLPELSAPGPSAAFAPQPFLSRNAMETISNANMAPQKDNPPPPPANSIIVWLRCL